MAPSTTKSAPKAKRATVEASRLIDERIQSLGDWRGDTLTAVRRMIHEAAPEIVENQRISAGKSKNR